MSESSDRELLDLIRRSRSADGRGDGARLGVTGTAMRNRLARLLGRGWSSARPSTGAAGVPGTPTRRASRRRSGWARTTRIWPWRSGKR